MKTKIVLEVDLNDEQLECLLSEINNTLDLMKIKVVSTTHELSQHDVSESFYCNDEEHGKFGIFEKCRTQCEDCKKCEQ